MKQTIETERLLLRELSLADLENIHALHSLAETDRYNTLGIPESIETSKQLVSDWLKTCEELPRVKYVFCIENHAQEFIGLLGINIGKPAYRKAEIWYKLHPTFWKRGMATEAVRGILHFCFTGLNLHRIEAGCAVENIASIRVLEKVGMIREGQGRKILPIRGQWMDNYEYAILETDYFQGNS